MPGIGGTWQDFDQVGPAVARRGAVFFVTDYRAHGTGQQYTADLVCGYRFARSNAGRYGGSLRLPVTLVGYSHGAYVAFGALQTQLYGPVGSYHPDVHNFVNGKMVNRPRSQAGNTTVWTILHAIPPAPTLRPDRQGRSGASQVSAPTQRVALCRLLPRATFTMTTHARPKRVVEPIVVEPSVPGRQSEQGFDLYDVEHCDAARS